jgi:hypothetical protein
MRQSGNTTRLVDAAIQALFKESVIYVPSGIVNPFAEVGIEIKGRYKMPLPFIDSEDTEMQKRFINILIKRLDTEHPNKAVYNKPFIILESVIKEAEKREHEEFIKDFEADITDKLSNAPKHIQERIEAVVIVQKDEKSLKVEEQLKKFHNMMNDLEKEF